MGDKEFIVNKNITLRLEKNRTNIYLSGEKFMQCKFLLLEIPVKDTVGLDELKSIDEFSEQFGNPFNIRTSQFPIIPPEVEFWGHCSNLQVWFENNYNTNLLHSNIAFPLLKKLSEIGDPIARRVFKEEIVKRIESGYGPTIIYLVMSHYLDFLTQEEFEVLIQEVRESGCVLDENILDLICSFDPALSENDIIFLVEHPKINLFELLIDFGKKFFDMDGRYIGEYRTWITDILHRLNKFRPKYLERKVRDLIKRDKIKIRKILVFDDVVGVNLPKLDYSLMDEFSIRLFNALYYGQQKIFRLDDLICN